MQYHKLQPQCNNTSLLQSTHRLYKRQQTCHLFCIVLVREGARAEMPLCSDVILKHTASFMYSFCGIVHKNQTTAIIGRSA